MPSRSTTAAVAFIRGINVGGKNPLPMGTLRTLCQSLGWADVVTYIQSGNVAFGIPAKSLGGGVGGSRAGHTTQSEKAAAALEEAIEDRCGFRPTVVVRIAADLRECIAANPFSKEAARDPKHVLVMFLAKAPTPAARKAVLALDPDPERLALTSREVFLWYPRGVGQSKFQFSRVEKAIGSPGTTRNWSTVAKMLEIADRMNA